MVWVLRPPLAAGSTTWAPEILPQPPESGNGHETYGVSCLTPDDCIAVGGNWSLAVHTRVTLAEQWNGASWVVLPTPNPPGLEEGWMFERYAVLTGVSCVSASSCVAVGYYRGPSETLAPLAERWDGEDWTMQAVPLPANSESGWLAGVSCWAGGGCVAVGSSTDESDVETTLVEALDETGWAIVASPNPPLTTLSQLLAVSCSSSTACTAAGFSRIGETNSALAERWDGGEWLLQPTDDPAGNEGSNRFEGVSCPIATACEAVGIHLERVGTSYAATALVEAWDGEEWSTQEVPFVPGAELTHLTSISCQTASSCTAAGYYRVDTGTGSPAEVMGVRWNGAAWSLLDLAGPPVPAGWWHEDWLYGVSCADAEACIAVGSSLSAPEGDLSPMRALAERELSAAAEEGGSSPEVQPDVRGGGAQKVPPAGSPSFKVAKVIRRPGGRVVLVLYATASGRFRVVALARKPTRRRLLYGKASSTALTGGRVKLAIVPNARARRVLGSSGHLEVHLQIVFSSDAGQVGSERTVVVHG
ncbi:MAG TPA: hypothetical protein VFI17_07450 [Solirubrobacterales bacterium]|nr:hypothetical protein [Solirubrobacterales bacterium]